MMSDSSHQLLQQTPAARSERGSNGELGAASADLAEHQRRDVHACDQQNDPHGAKRRQQRRPHVADERVADRHDRRRLGFVPSGRIFVPAPERRRDRGERPVHVIDARALGDPPDQRPVAVVVVRAQWSCGPDADGGCREPEAARHDADDRPLDSTELEAPANQSRIAAELLP
jgi:hypothetical protein